MTKGVKEEELTGGAKRVSGKRGVDQQVVLFRSTMYRFYKGK
jgi:hypothetical protein